MNNGLYMRYFVLKPGLDSVPVDVYERASRAAMRVYADVIADANYKFSCDLRVWLNKLENPEREDSG